MKIVKKIIAKIEKYDRIAIFTHKSIDGDSYSSSYGLALAIKEKYPAKKVRVLTDRDYLETNFPFLEAKKSLFAKTVGPDTLGIIGDTAIKQRIQFFDQFQKCTETICFDHHQDDTNLNLSLYWREPKYPASAIQAIEIAFELQSQFKEATAVALLVGILTDTGFFKYSTNDTKAPTLYAKLLAFTTDKRMNELFIGMNAKTKDDIAIQQFIYTNIVFQKNLAYVVIDTQIVAKYSYNQIKMKIGSIANIVGYDYWAFFIEQNENGFKYKVSLRTATRNVNKIARQFNGGGHIKAAGCFARDGAEMKKLVNYINKQK